MNKLCSIGVGFLVALLCLQSVGAAIPQTQPDFTNTLGMRFRRIVPGSFIMGQDGPAADYRMRQHGEKFDDADFDERSSHRVTLTTPFFMGVTEVTVAEYHRFKPDSQKNLRTDEAARGVSWHDATEFCKWLSEREGRFYRLPTEAEWEYACRAGTTTLFSSGDALPPASHKWYSGIGWLHRYLDKKKPPTEYKLIKGSVPSLPVARGQPNPWGLYDMHGNVAEWCLDWYGAYTAEEKVNPRGPQHGDFKVFRGGHHSIFTRYLRSANRGSWIPASRSQFIGFRVVLAESELAPLEAAAVAPSGVKPPVQEQTAARRCRSCRW